MLYDLYGFENMMKSELFSFVSSFHMSLFIFISGIFSKTHIVINDIPYDLYKRFRSLIIPAIVVGIPYTYLLGFAWNDYIWNGMKRGYWHLFVLFALIIVNYLFCLPHKRQGVVKCLYAISLVLWVGV